MELFDPLEDKVSAKIASRKDWLREWDRLLSPRKAEVEWR